MGPASPAGALSSADTQLLGRAVWPSHGMVCTLAEKPLWRMVSRLLSVFLVSN